MPSFSQRDTLPVGRVERNIFIAGTEIVNATPDSFWTMSGNRAVKFSGSDLVYGDNGKLISGTIDDIRVYIDGTEVSNQILIITTNFNELTGAELQDAFDLIGIGERAAAFELVLDNWTQEYWSWSSQTAGRLYGTNNDDGLFGSLGNDRIDGYDGDDFIGLSGGDDIGYGGNGDDRIDGGYGNDRLYGGDGNDQLNGEAFGRSIVSLSGDDLLNGGAGNDVLRGGFGADILIGGADDDLLFGGHDNDRLIGGSGNDVLDAGYGSDILKGGDGDDRLFGGGRDETDRMTGGDGADTFVFGGRTGADIVYDFEMGTDTLELYAGGSFDSLSIIQLSNGFARIAYNESVILLVDTDASLLSAADFDFV